MYWNLRDKIEKIISDNCKEIKYEGTYVQKASMLDEIMSLLQNDDKGKPKFYEFSWEGDGYGNGVLVVVAQTEDEAREYARDNDWRWQYSCVSANVVYTGKYTSPFTFVEQYYQE